jgi:hypothetical protein
LAFLPTPRAQNGEARNQNIWARPPDQPQNLENALAFLPTPTVMDMGSNYTPEEWAAWKAKQKAAHNNGNGHGASLTQEALSLIGTPTASMSHRSKRGIGKDPNPRELAAMINMGLPLGAPTSLLFTDGKTPSDDLHQPPLFDEASATDSTPSLLNG